MKKMSFEEMAAAYCETQVCTPQELRETLKAQVGRFSPEGFFICQAQLMGSSWFGQHVILPYGPNNTYKEVPTHPLSPRGLASDTSVVTGYLPVEDL